MKAPRIKIGKRLVLLLFASAMLFTIQGVSVSAETTKQPASAWKIIIDNPQHHCAKRDGDADITEWSYIYFGSYPQTEVTGIALTLAITGATYDRNGDAWVNGQKYRRISKSDTNFDGDFGNQAYRYFKWERIKWRVLQDNGSTLFVAADKGLDCRDYHEQYVLPDMMIELNSITWECCTLRNWLNTSFYDMAFSVREQEAIVEQDVINEDNPDYGTAGGVNTNDKLYLLSIREMTNPAYGFCDAYTVSSASRRLQASDYANARGVRIDMFGDYKGACDYWLRSPGDETYSAARVPYNGCVDIGGRVSYGGLAVVPAMHIRR